MTSPPPQIPDLRHLRRLGHGGFADVHLYEQAMPLMPVAVKVLRPSASDLGVKLVAEANTMAELAEHPYIASILRAGVTDDGRPYLVMSYYPQPNLSEQARAQPLSVSGALRTGIQVASAVETAHRAGILHRDIKPANILVSSYGTPALSDFGIAGRSATVGDGGEVGVSVAWTAPEVLRGVSNGSVGADVYSLAATISFLLTGRTPFEVVAGDNSNDALVARTVREAPTPTGRPDVPESLELLLQQGMAKDVATRPESALALARSLQGIEQELRLPRTETVLLRPVGHDAGDLTGDATTIRAAMSDAGPRVGSRVESPSAEAPQGQGRRLLAVGLGALVLASAVGAGVMLGGRDQPDPAETATSGSATTPVGSATSPTSSPSTTGSTTTAPAGVLDPCLVGRWRTVAYREPVPGVGEITSLERQITIDANRRMVVSYDKAAASGIEGLVFDGTVEYTVSTQAGTMSFTLVRNDGTLSAGGTETPLTPGVSDVQYTCQGDTFTEKQGGFSTSLERVPAG